MTKAPKKQHKQLLKAAVLVFSVLFTLYTACSTVLVGYYLGQFFGRAEREEHTGYLGFDDLKVYYDCVTVSFLSGNNTLRGYVWGNSNDKGLIVFAHGLGGGAEDYTAVIKYFLDNGWRVFAYDGTGSYDSGGRGTVGLAQSLLDLDAALSYCESSAALSSLPKAVMGHSWGGYAAAAVLNSGHDIAASVSFSGYELPIDMLSEFSSRAVGSVPTFLIYPFLWLYNTAAFGSQSAVSAVDAINASGTPIMIIHGENDKTVSPTGAGIIAHSDSITSQSAKLVTVPNRGHNDIFFSDRAIKYVSDKNEEYKALYQQYGGEIPENELDEFYAGVDRSAASALDSALFKQINDFLEQEIR